MELAKLKSIIEALVMVSEEPLTINALVLVLEADGVTKADIETAVGEIKARHDDDPSAGFYLSEVAGGYQFRTRTGLAEYIQRLNIPKSSKLSQQALETLAIIAYRQPVVRSEIEEIRGVDSGGVLKTLLERSLIKIIGKRDEVGNPLIYSTTSKFLELFNLNSLTELPTLREYEELEKEHYIARIKPTEEETQPILDGVATEPLSQKWSAEDEGILSDLSSGIKKLRKLEKEIFPKPVETITLVPNPEGGLNSLPETPTDADTVAEDTGAID